MEQSYLDNYELVYNVNRVASSNYEPSTASVNEGEDNPSYDLKGGGNTHLFGIKHIQTN